MSNQRHLPTHAPESASRPPSLVGTLALQDWQVMLHLGVSAAERAQPQSVAIDLQIQFTSLPPACQSDRLEETICYDQLLRSLKIRLEMQQYHLLEYLAYQLYRWVQELLPATAQLSYLKVTKLTPPIAGLGASSFVLHYNS